MYGWVALDMKLHFRIARHMTGTNETSSKEAMFHEASMREVKVAYEAKCSNVTLSK